MSFTLRVSAGGVPVGGHIATFVGVEPTKNDYGDGLKWIFEVVSGPSKGAKTYRITSQAPTLKNACGRMVSGITGKPLVIDEDVKLDQYFGKSYLVMVTTTEGGGTRVDSVSAPPVS